MFFSKWLLRISSAWGVNEVLRLRFFEGSLPINSVRFCMPDLWRASASAIQRSRTGLIFWALLGVMSNFSNLAGYKRPGFSLPVRLLAIVFSWASCGRKKWLLRMVCLGRIEKKESYLGALPEQGISCLPFFFSSTRMPLGLRLASRFTSEPNPFSVLYLETPPLQQLEVTAASGELIFLEEPGVLCPKLAIVE